MPLSTNELLAKAFKDSPSQSNRIILNVRQTANQKPEIAYDSGKSSLNWMELAEKLEESGM